MHFKRFSTEDGLSHSKVNCFLEDSRGYMWIGTDDGLNRFSGFTFKVFKDELPQSRIKDIIKDDNGHLWIGTANGLCLYEPEKEKFTHFTKVGDCENCLAGQVISTLELDGNEVWIGTNAGLSKINIETHEIESWYYDENTDVVEVLFAVRDIEIVDSQRLLLASDEGLIFYNKMTKTFTYFNEEHGLKSRGLETIYKDRNGEYWLASDRDGVYKVTEGLEHPKFELNPSYIMNMEGNVTVYDFTEDADGKLWIGSYFGLTIVDTKTGTISYHNNDPLDEFSLNQNQVSQIYKDRNDRIWIGTPSGINVYDPYYNQFELMSKIDENPLGAIFCFLEDHEHNLWMGSQNNGIYIIKKNGETDHLVPRKQVYALEEDDDQKVWASVPHRMHIFEEGSLSYFDKVPTASVYQIKKDDQGNLWMATHGEGVVKIDEAGVVKQFKYFNNDPLLSSKNYVINLDFDSKGRIWTGNFNLGGAIIKNPSSDSVFYKINGDKPFYLKNVNDYHFENESVILSTIEGIFYFENAEQLLSDTSATFTKINDAYSYEIIPGKPDNLWVSSTSGLYKIDLKNKTSKSYKHQIPKKYQDFNHSAGLKTQDGYLYFGNSNGLVKFKPENIKPNPNKPIVRLKNLKILNELLITSSDSLENRSLPLEISYLEEIKLLPKDKIFSIEMEVINFTANGGIQKEYFLEGFDEGWQQAESNIITRSNLSPGKYTLRIRAINNDGLTSDETTLDIHVIAPWWKRWWAYLIYLAMVVLLFIGMMTFRINQERKLEHVRTTERETFRKRSAQDFHDEAGTKITRISLLTEMAKRAAAESPIITSHLERIEQNLEELNYGMRDFIWSLDIDKDNLLETINRFIDFAGSICEEADISFTSSAIDPSLEGLKADMEDRRNIILLLKEVLNNSIKHSGASEISFSVEKSDVQVVIQLSDNGKGFETSTAKKGNGLRNIANRAEKLSAVLNIESQVHSGTKITLTLNETLFNSS
ncbi:sensor histidine kinase [Portibacter lacus]|uniref:sensor histidine kinase n=1 Tax=Portibacter lacus TaxID=1099794 RepID=UPI001F3D67DF|nr:sensor histidine kinase [Portibacter lacus]